MFNHKRFTSRKKQKFHAFKGYVLPCGTMEPASSVVFKREIGPWGIRQRSDLDHIVRENTGFDSMSDMVEAILSSDYIPTISPTWGKPVIDHCVRKGIPYHVAHCWRR